MKKLIICTILLLTFAAMALPASAYKKIVSETIEAAAKKSGKALPPALRKAATKVLINASKQYGDDVFKIVSRGGLEALEQGAKHGKVFWELCSHAPKITRNLALHAKEI